MKRASLSLGPILFNWSPDVWRDFYFRMADEAPVDFVYIGEVVCSKRAPFFEPHYAEVVERLHKAKKNVVFSSLAEVMISRERNAVSSLCETDDWLIEANDATALYALKGKPHYVGPYVNVYNEDTLRFLAGRGAKHITLPFELSKDALPPLAAMAKKLKLGLEMQVYGRIPLALSARCYHARAHGRMKDNCQFVCGEDPNGMKLRTRNGQDFLVINGIQTLSYGCLNLLREIHQLGKFGINVFRLSPHTHDMVKVAQIFRAAIDERLDLQDATKKLEELAPDLPSINGFFHHKAGCSWLEDTSTLSQPTAKRRLKNG